MYLFTWVFFKDGFSRPKESSFDLATTEEYIYYFCYWDAVSLKNEEKLVVSSIVFLLETSLLILYNYE